MRYRSRGRTFHCLAWLALALGAAGPGGAAAATLRWASEADAASLDPYTRDESMQLSLLANIYEPLARRGADLSLQPALAVSWERTAPTRWRFHLRTGVKWQDGTPFSSADVLFSLRRVKSPTSLLHAVTAAVSGAQAVDPLTVDLETASPDPILPQQLTHWYIMSQAWAEAHQTTQPALLSEAHENYASRHAMGTGPFQVAERDPDHRTVLERNPNWWDKPDDLVDRVEFDVLTAQTTRVAALISGQADVATDIPPQDADYVAHTSGLKLLSIPELRIIFLGMDQSRDQLLKSDVKGRNPFRDQRVRLAIALAIDEEAIVAKVMRGQARPTWLMWAPGVSGYDAALDHRPEYDPDRAKTLLAEAGYPNGFDVTLDCPNDRYVMDEAICTSLAPMLARIGIRLDVDPQPKARFFKKIGPPGYDTSFYLLGWTPSTYDALNVLFNLVGTREGARGAINFGGFSDPVIDGLIAQIGGTDDAAARDALIDEAAKRLQAAVGYVPLHQQRLLWGARDGVDVPQSPDGALLFRLVRMKQ